MTWWFDINRFNINDPTTFGHIKDGKDDMALLTADIHRTLQIQAAKSKIKETQLMLIELRTRSSELQNVLSVQQTRLAGLEAEDQRAAQERTEAKVRQQLETARTYWPRFNTYEAEILKVLEQDKLATDRWNALSIGTGKMAYAHTLLTAYQTVVKRHETIQPLYTPYMPYIYGPLSLSIMPRYFFHNTPKVSVNPVPVVDVTKVGTRVVYSPDSSQSRKGIVIPRPAEGGHPKTSACGEGDFVYILTDDDSSVFGCYKKNLKAL